MKEFSTTNVQIEDRAAQWNAAISDAYFPLQLHFHDPVKFQGKLSGMGLGKVGISRLVSSPVNYERRLRHINYAHDEEYLITIPKSTSVEFRQLGKVVTCDPGGFIVQRGDEPYRFMHENSNDLFVLKVPKSSLAERVRRPDRYCAKVIDATKGCANLFTTMVTQIQLQGLEAKPSSQEIVGKHLLVLLSLALDENPDIEISNSSSVRAAHINRVDHYIRDNLKNPNLSPGLVSTACGISKRYLHDLFRDENTTVSQQIRDQRLIAARDRLAELSEDNVSDVAYRYGFTDHSQFSRLFKSKFGLSPSEHRRIND
jgi:AraC-like DNA-binding protein